MRSATCDTQHEMRCRASPSRARPSAQPGRLLQKAHQRRAVFGADDDLLRHFRARRVARRADLEEFLDGLGVPDDIELFERLGKIIAGCGGDAAAEDAVQRRAGAVAVVRIERMAGGASPEHLGPAVALEGGEHVLAPRQDGWADRLAGFHVPAPHRTMRSPPPVNSSDPSGRKASDHTGRPGPTRLNRTRPVARSMMAADPAIEAAAIVWPSGESASAMMGLGPVSMRARIAPVRSRMRTAPSAPAAAISPSGAATTPFSGVESVTTVGGPSRGQRRTVASYPAVTTRPSGATATALTLPWWPSSTRAATPPSSGITRAVPSQEAEATRAPSGDTAKPTIGPL